MTIVTSAVTLLEVLVVPYRAGNLALATRYEEILTRSRGVVLREIDRASFAPPPNFAPSPACAPRMRCNWRPRSRRAARRS